MDILSSVEVRVLGSLIEKQMATPEYYPLTLNALVNACNQISNRDPVVSYDEKTVARALETLREKGLIWVVSSAGGRVPKYEHRLTERLKLAEQEAAVLGVLMLRGPQTVGEIRGRTGRMYEFSELAEVEAILDTMTRAEPDPLVVRLPRQHGLKEPRFAHLLAGEVRLEESETTAPVEPARLEVQAERERIARLEEQLEKLRADFEALKSDFSDFKKQFE
ncbi:MAG TPA: YceH family protein [Blastocatellia bacterium]|nr:YceH family protein [Blastocatellia bacterium]